MEQIVWSTAIASVVGGLIGIAIAFLIISRLNALMKKNDRIVKLEAGQAKLEASQADLQRSLVNVEAGLSEIRGLLNQPRPATGDIP